MKLTYKLGTLALYTYVECGDSMAENTSEKAWFLIIRSSSEGLHEHILEPGKNNLGRDTDNDIILFDNAASSHHAAIHCDQTTDALTIQDLKSTNGTFVNGKRIYKSQSLQHDDQIRIGRCLISIVYSEKRSSYKHPVRHVPTKVTGELILESIDQYGVLLH